jgi:hypothetical protein
MTAHVIPNTQIHDCSWSLYDKDCQWLTTGRRFYPGNPVSSTNKTNRHDITEVLLKVALNTISITLFSQFSNKMAIYRYKINKPPWHFTDSQRIVRWFSLESPVSSNNKTDSHDTSGIVLKMALSTITLTPTCNISMIRTRNFSVDRHLLYR